ncbi:MAG: hypothetical protein IPN49_09340 [Saprospiraceae bacterium]|nr:hypothetical protein [Saprospiraceae bacterium]
MKLSSKATGELVPVALLFCQVNISLTVVPAKELGKVMVAFYKKETL